MFNDLAKITQLVRGEIAVRAFSFHFTPESSSILSPVLSSTTPLFFLVLVHMVKYKFISQRSFIGYGTRESRIGFFNELWLIS